MKLQFKKTNSRNEYWDQNIHTKDGDIIEVDSYTTQNLLKYFPDNFKKLEDIPATLTYEPHPTILKPKKRLDKLSFSYFYDTPKSIVTVSFIIVAQNQIKALRDLGYEVEEKNISFIDKPIIESKGNIAIIHPLLLILKSKEWNQILENLYNRFSYVVAFDVADTTSINKEYVKILNDSRIDAIIVPSQFSYNAYRMSGVVNRTLVIPHGVNENFKPQEEKQTGNPKVLTICPHSELRKGGDLFFEVAKKFPDVEFIFKGDTENKLANVRIIKDFLTEDDLIKLYQSSDIFLYGFRAGAFEIPVLESLACGLILIATGWGCILDYANLHNSLLSGITSYSKIFFPENFNNGYGAEPNLNELIALLRYSLDNFDKLKKRALATSKYIRNKFSWENAVRLFIKDCKEIIDETTF